MRILLVEDDKLSRHMLKTLLTKWEHEVIACKNGEEAWTILNKENPPTVLLLDWLMPKLNGEELCKKIRAAGKHCYIIVMSGAHSEDDIENVITAGADDYLRKGCRSQELLIHLKTGETILDLKTQIQNLKSISTKKLDDEHILERSIEYCHHMIENLASTIGIHRDFKKLHEVKETTEDMNEEPFKNSPSDKKKAKTNPILVHH